MQRFPDDALLNDQAAGGHLDEQLLMALADHIARFHATAEVITTDAGSARFGNVVEAVAVISSTRSNPASSAAACST